MLFPIGDCEEGLDERSGRDRCFGRPSLGQHLARRIQQQVREIRAGEDTL
jgi:hypothetical protein